MKIGEPITEAKKVRCKSCGSVILLTPNPSEPNGMAVTLPKKTDRPSSMSRSNQQLLLAGGLIGLALFLALGLWWTFSNPSDRGSVEGAVKYDNAPLDRGTIVFLFSKDGKETSATAPIKQGRYSISAARGPAIGLNKVEIRGDENNPVHARYNTESELSAEISLGPNTKDYEVKSQ